MTELINLSLDDAQKAVRRGDVTSLELVEACLNQIEEHDNKLNAVSYTHLTLPTKA